MISVVVVDTFLVLGRDGEILCECQHRDTADLIAHRLAEAETLRAQLDRAIRIAQARRPLCVKCEIEQGLGYCRCDPSKYD